MGIKMKLDDWLKKNNVNFTAFARKMGISYDVLYHWRMGKSTPNAKYLYEIWKITNGGVHLVNTGFLQFDKMFPQWSVRRATTEELMLYKLENPDACL